MSSQDSLNPVVLLFIIIAAIFLMFILCDFTKCFQRHQDSRTDSRRHQRNLSRIPNFRSEQDVHNFHTFANNSTPQDFGYKNISGPSLYSDQDYILNHQREIDSGRPFYVSQAPPLDDPENPSNPSSKSVFGQGTHQDPFRVTKDISSKSISVPVGHPLLPGQPLGPLPTFFHSVRKSHLGVPTIVHSLSKTPVEIGAIGEFSPVSKVHGPTIPVEIANDSPLTPPFQLSPCDNSIPTASHSLDFTRSNSSKNHFNLNVPESKRSNPALKSILEAFIQSIQQSNNNSHHNPPPSYDQHFGHIQILIPNRLSAASLNFSATEYHSPPPKNGEIPPLDSLSTTLDLDEDIVISPCESDCSSARVSIDEEIRPSKLKKSIDSESSIEYLRQQSNFLPNHIPKAFVLEIAPYRSEDLDLHHQT